MSSEYPVDYGFEDEDRGEEGGIRLKTDIDIGELRNGKSVEIEIDDSSFNPEGKVDESSKLYEENEVYKTSELYFLGEGESDEEDGPDVSQFDKLRKRMHSLPVTDGKVTKRVLKEGMGPTIAEFIAQKAKDEQEKPEAEGKKFEQDDINVASHYTINTQTSAEPIDNSYLRSDRPVRTFLNDELLPGHRYALLSMKEKEVADFLVHPDLAYGKMGVPPRIPPNATLRYKIELQKFWASTELDGYLKMSRDEKRVVPVKKLVKMCSQQREEANKLFTTHSDYKGANCLYTKAIRILEDASLKDGDDETMQQKALLKLYLNKAMVTLKLQRYDQTITYSNKALDIQPRNVKALYRKSQAKMKFGDFREAKKLALQAYAISSRDQNIGALLKEIESEEKRQKDIEKQLCARMINMKAEPQKKSSSFSSELHERISRHIKAFVSSREKEIRLNATTYTDAELTAFKELSPSHKLTALANKEGCRWISLRLLKE